MSRSAVGSHGKLAPREKKRDNEGDKRDSTTRLARRKEAG
jgi:hypothetical protein